jgi:hypothetical protein
MEQTVACRDGAGEYHSTTTSTHRLQKDGRQGAEIRTSFACARLGDPAFDSESKIDSLTRYGRPGKQIDKNV